MTLADLIDRYIQDHPYGISASHADQLRWAVHGWQAFHGWTLTLTDLIDERLNAYLDWMRVHRAPDTLRTRRGNLLTLWRFAWEEGLVDSAPRKIRRVRPVRHYTQAWTVSEVRSLISAAERLHGRFRGTSLSRARYMTALIRAGYDTALRLGDLLALEAASIPLSGAMVLRQRKTKRDVIVQFREQTIEAIGDTLADDPCRHLIWPLWGRREAVYRIVRQIVREAGIRQGTFRWIRRSAITQVERLEAGAGTILAGHQSRQTTERWYIDRSQLNPPLLPPL